ncbi:hypothetical protein [uncultured Bilophila sp.]|uniref:hypothetical protein n=1 Tax=uncultured Bilophila sp. TaxID=529385 RepID=UPI002670BB0B|nr:hypothetical protein [uncultured Bilophila sp.]
MPLHTLPGGASGKGIAGTPDALAAERRARPERVPFAGARAIPRRPRPSDAGGPLPGTGDPAGQATGAAE